MYLANEEAKADVDIMHVGILGMRWGHRKQSRENRGQGLHGAAGGIKKAVTGSDQDKETKEAKARIVERFKKKEARDNMIIASVRKRAQRDVDEMVDLEIRSSMGKGKTLSTSEKNKIRKDYEQAFHRDLNYTSKELNRDRRARAVATVAGVIAAIGYMSVLSAATLH